jgi:hypothetical protein
MFRIARISATATKKAMMMAMRIHPMPALLHTPGAGRDGVRPLGLR